jgi:hypothetical protein
LDGGIFMSLALTDEKLSTFYILEILDNISVYIDARDIEIPPTDAAHRDESNELCSILLRLLDDEIFLFTFILKIQLFIIFFLY